MALRVSVRLPMFAAGGQANGSCTTTMSTTPLQQWRHKLAGIGGPAVQPSKIWSRPEPGGRAGGRRRRKTNYYGKLWPRIRQLHLLQCRNSPVFPDRAEPCGARARDSSINGDVGKSDTPFSCCVHAGERRSDSVSSKNRLATFSGGWLRALAYAECRGPPAQPHPS